MRKSFRKKSCRTCFWLRVLVYPDACDKCIDYSQWVENKKVTEQAQQGQVKE